MSRWQGTIDAKLAEHARRLDVINGDARAARLSGEKLLVEVAVIRTKVALWSATGGLLGAGAVTAIVAVIT